MAARAKTLRDLHRYDTDVAQLVAALGDQNYREIQTGGAHVTSEGDTFWWAANCIEILAGTPDRGLGIVIFYDGHAKAVRKTSFGTARVLRDVEIIGTTLKALGYVA